MTTHQGFSLFDLLLTLVFVSGTALGLVTQQWQITRLFNSSLYNSHILIAHDNTAEHSRVL